MHLLTQKVTFELTDCTFEFTNDIRGFLTVIPVIQKYTKFRFKNSD